MQINPDFNISAYTIRSYEPSQINVFTPISEEDIRASMESEDKKPIQHTTSLDKPFIIASDRLITDWQASSPNALKTEDFAQIVELNIAILLLGTGKRIIFPDPKYQAYVQRHGIGMEVMTTEAACRTYNFLVSDERKVAAALFMIEAEYPFQSN